MRAGVLSQIPNLHAARLVAADQFALIGMYDHVVDGSIVDVITLHHGGSVVSSGTASNRPGRDLPRVPHFDCAVLAARDYPLALRRVRQGGDVGGVPFECSNRVGIQRRDVPYPVHQRCLPSYGKSEAAYRTDAFPAAARNILSGLMASLLTCFWH